MRRASLTSPVEAPDLTIAPPVFAEFASISRLSRDMVVTEKIDGTNAQVHITENGQVFAGSRTRWITPEVDNYGFARWVREHEDELRLLGPGSHYGEWWGSGIQRRYGLIGDDKRFSLFNVARWKSEHNAVVAQLVEQPIRNGQVEGSSPSGGSTVCIEVPVCHVVPVLLRWTFNTGKVDEALAHLSANGSAASPGFMKPEGVVVYHAGSRTLFKKTLDKNDGHKSA